MPEASAVFSLLAQNHRDNWVHCKALFAGGVDAAASIHRGVDLSASIDLETRLSGKFQKAAVANLEAGGDAKAAITLQGAFPIDLFKQAGVIGKLEATAEAAAWVQATVGLDVGFFETMLLRGALDGVWLQLVDIFVSELSISAGVWGAASFSAEAWANAFFVGNLVELDDGSDPGFTFSCGYGAGWGGGYGGDFIVNLGITDSARMLNRLADRVSGILATEIERQAGSVSPADHAAAARGLAFLKFVLPLATRVAFETGVELTSTAFTNRTSPDGSGMVRAFVREMQEFALQGIVNLAATAINQRLRALIGGSLPTFDRPTVAQIAGALDAAIDAVDQLANGDVGDIDTWFDRATSAANALVALGNTPLLRGAAIAAHQNDVALLWAAATLTRKVVSWVGSMDNASDPRSGNPFDATAAPPGVDAALVGYIAGRPVYGPNRNTPKPPGSPLTFADLVVFILADDATRKTVQAIEAQVPQVAPVFQWLDRACQALGGSALLPFLFQDVAAIIGGKPDHARQALVATIKTAVDSEIVPRLFAALEKSSDPTVVELLRRVVRPTVLALGDVILPGIVNVKNDEDAGVLREQVSAVLLQFLTRFLMTSVDLVSARAFSDGADFLDQTANDIRQHGVGGKVDALLQLCARDVPGLAPTDEDIADILALLAAAMRYYNANTRGPIVATIEDLLNLGLYTDESMDQVYALENPRDPSNPAGLFDLLGVLQDGLWDSMQIFVPQALAIVVRHYERAGVQLQQIIAAGVHDAVVAVEQAAQWLQQHIGQLENAIAQAEQDMLDATRKIADTVQSLSTAAIGLEQGILDALRAYGWSLIQPLLAALPADVAAAAQNYYNQLFDDARTLLDAPFDVLSEVAGWVHDEAVQELQAGTLTPQNLIQAVQTKVLQLTASDLTFPITVSISVQLGNSFFGYYTVSKSFNVGTITIPSATVANTIRNAIFNDTIIGSYVADIVAHFKALQTSQVQRNAAQAQLDDANVQIAAPQIVTGQLLVATFASPTAGSVWDRSAPVQIRISGADETFFAATQGVAARARIYLNGTEVPYGPEEWTRTGNDFVFDAVLVASTVGLAPECTRLSPARLAATAATKRGNPPSKPGNITKPKSAVTPATVGRTAAPTKPAATVGTAATAAASARRMFQRLQAPTMAEQQAGLLWQIPPARALAIDAEAIDPDLPPASADGASADRVLVGLAGANTLQCVVVDGDQQKAQSVTSVTLRPAARVAQKLYAAIFAPGLTQARVISGLKTDDFVRQWQQLGTRGLRLRDLDTYTLQGERYWTGIFEPGTDAHLLFLRMTWDELAAKWAEQRSHGLRIVALASYREDRRYWAAVWRQGNGPDALWCGEWAAFADPFAKMGEQGLRVTEFETFLDDRGVRQWAAVWGPGAGGYFMQKDYDWRGFQAKHDELTRSGFALASFAEYSDGDVRRFAGSWIATGASTKITPGLKGPALQKQIAALAQSHLGPARLRVFPGYL